MTLQSRAIAALGMDPSLILSTHTAACHSTFRLDSDAQVSVGICTHLYALTHTHMHKHPLPMHTHNFFLNFRK